jgi:hypothetical protein
MENKTIFSNKQKETLELYYYEDTTQLQSVFDLMRWLEKSRN